MQGIRLRFLTFNKSNRNVFPVTDEKFTNFWFKKTGKYESEPPQDFGHLDRDSSNDTDRLKSSDGTFRVHRIYGDGNCMYRSISYIVWGDEDEHGTLRTMVVEHIRNNWREYSPFVMAEWNISDRDEYYDFMMTNGRYATELECVVATRLYGMNLSIYRETDSRGNLKRIFHNRISRNYRTARLLFSGRTESGHYDVLIPVH